MITPDQELLWVLRAQCQDHEAFELLLRSVERSLQRYVRGLVGVSDADDVLQEVFLAMYRKLDRLEDPELFRPWVFRIASRAGIRHLKKRQRWMEQACDEMTLADVAGNEKPPDEVLDALVEVGEISPASRGVLILHFREEMTLPEIAAILEIPVGTVKSRLAYGLAALRRQFGEKRSM